MLHAGSVLRSVSAAMVPATPLPMMTYRRMLVSTTNACSPFPRVSSVSLPTVLVNDAPDACHVAVPRKYRLCSLLRANQRAPPRAPTAYPGTPCVQTYAPTPANGSLRHVD